MRTTSCPSSAHPMDQNPTNTPPSIWYVHPLSWIVYRIDTPCMPVHSSVTKPLDSLDILIILSLLPSWSIIHEVKYTPWATQKERKKEMELLPLFRDLTVNHPIRIIDISNGSL